MNEETLLTFPKGGTHPPESKGLSEHLAIESLPLPEEVDILLQNQDCEEMCLARLGPGQFFGEVELTQGGNSIASVRASAGAPAEVALLPKSEFFQLIDGSPLTRSVMDEVASTRLVENRQSKEGAC